MDADLKEVLAMFSVASPGGWRRWKTPEGSDVYDEIVAVDSTTKCVDIKRTFRHEPVLPGCVEVKVKIVKEVRK